MNDSTRTIKNEASTRTILVVDDEFSVRRALSFMLRAHGFDVFEAKNTFEALSILEDETVHLALIDLVLPDKNGIELAQDIMRLKPHTKIIVMTAHRENAIAQQAEKLFKENFLEKSEIDESLTEHIEQLLDTSPHPST